MKYRKKPIIIEAEIYQKGMEDGFERVNDDGMCSFCQDSCAGCKNYKPFISTLEGKHYITKGDYIITGVKGERYPCKPDIFKMTYEPVEAEP